MRQKLIYLLIILSIIFAPRVNATCDYKEQAELNKEASNIKITYGIGQNTMKATEPNEAKTVTISYEMFKVNILNLSNKFYVTYTNNVNHDQKTFYSPNTVDGVVSFDWEDLSRVTTMTFKIFATDKTNCKDTLYRTVYLTLPRYNKYSAWSICNDHKGKSVCDKYVTFDEISYSQFLDRLQSGTKNTPESTSVNNNTTTVQTTNNKYLFIEIGAVAAVIVVIIVASAIIINKKRNKL